MIMIDFTRNDIGLIVLIVSISQLAGVYLSSSLYGQRSEVYSPFGTKKDNPLHKMLSWFLTGWEVPNWIAIPLFVIHVIMVMTITTSMILSTMFAFDQHVLFLIITLPFVVSSVVVFWILRPPPKIGSK
ncbi:MAG: hypothetical protein ABIH67_03645 [Candidatus Uhrbacteria bacterium]